MKQHGSVKPAHQSFSQNQSMYRRSQNNSRSPKRESIDQLLGYKEMDFKKYQEVEYAKLIAKQFPIYDEKGILIDYSNINDY